MSDSIFFKIGKVLLITIICLFLFLFFGFIYVSVGNTFWIKEGDGFPYNVDPDSFLTCRFGSKAIRHQKWYDEDCNKIDYNLDGGSVYVCSNCGDGECKEWESKCNCPEDCK